MDPISLAIIAIIVSILARPLDYLWDVIFANHQKVIFGLKIFGVFIAFICTPALGIYAFMSVPLSKLSVGILVVSIHIQTLTGLIYAMLNVLRLLKRHYNLHDLFLTHLPRVNKKNDDSE